MTHHPRTRAICLALTTTLAVLIAGCWADFPKSRFNQDGPGQDTAILDMGVVDAPMDQAPVDGAARRGVRRDRSLRHPGPGRDHGIRTH